MGKKQHYKVCVIGGGVSGLSAAHSVLNFQNDSVSIDVDLLESTHHLGGNIHSVQTPNGFVFELGPQSMQAKYDQVHTFLNSLGLNTNARLYRPNSAGISVLIQKFPSGLLYPAPNSPLTLIQTPLLSIPARFRALLEPIVPKRIPTEQESVFAFFSRRFGVEIAAHLVDPALSGIYSGDIHQLAIKYALPTVWRAEQEHGSVMKGMLVSKKQQEEDSKHLSRSFSFQSGMSTLIQSIQKNIQQQGARIKLKTAANSIEFYRRGLDQVEWKVNGTKYDAVICAVPAFSLDSIRSKHVLFQSIASKIEYVPVAIVASAWKRTHAVSELIKNRFGALLASRGSESGLLGVTFSSEGFAGRTPNDEEYFSVASFIGGALHRDRALVSTSEIISEAVEGTKEVLNIPKDVVQEDVRVRVWPKGIPQPGSNHGELLNQVESMEEQYPGLYFAGNYLRGVGVPDAIVSGLSAGERAQERLLKLKDK